VIDVLRGKDERARAPVGPRQAVDLRHRRGHAEKEWRGIFRQLVALGLLAVDHAHGALILTEASRPVLKGEQDVPLRRAPEKKKAATTKSRRIDSDLRRRGTRPVRAPARLARRHGAGARRAGLRNTACPAYVILHDATLLELAREAPVEPRCPAPRQRHRRAQAGEFRRGAARTARRRHSSL
jgi:ATP-dependent DNA helicase RecQ